MHEVQRRAYDRRGPAGFGDTELLALAVGYPGGKRASLELAAAMLHRFGDLGRVAAATPRQLRSFEGVGWAASVRLHAALQAGFRASQRSVEFAAAVRSPTEAAGLLVPSLGRAVDEELHALYLDRRLRLIATRELTRGCDGFTIVEPRQIFRHAVGVSASAVVLAHNHPSGDPTPSEQDIEVTRRVVEAGRTLGIAVRDHLVIGAGGAWVSMAERGLMPGAVVPRAGWTG